MKNNDTPIEAQTTGVNIQMEFQSKIVCGQNATNSSGCVSQNDPNYWLKVFPRCAIYLRVGWFGMCVNDSIFNNRLCCESWTIVWYHTQCDRYSNPLCCVIIAIEKLMRKTFRLCENSIRASGFRCHRLPICWTQWWCHTMHIGIHIEYGNCVAWKKGETRNYKLNQFLIWSFKQIN